MLVRTANKEDPNQTASSEAVLLGSAQKQSYWGLLCLSRPYLDEAHVQNFRTFTVYCFQKRILCCQLTLESIGKCI